MGADLLLCSFGFASRFFNSPPILLDVCGFLIAVVFFLGFLLVFVFDFCIIWTVFMFWGFRVCFVFFVSGLI